jgi:hypothetical protein
MVSRSADATLLDRLTLMFACDMSAVTIFDMDVRLT